LPDGFRALLAPAAALPASLFMPVVEPPTELPVVVPLGLVVLGADAPGEVVPPVEPVPVCAMANVLASVSAAASPSVLNFMLSFLSRCERKIVATLICSGFDFNWV
jgi:hypothetical protein